MTFRIFSLGILTAAVFAVPALAHHSFAMFDDQKKVTIEGTVKEFEWSNPHAWMHLVVIGKNGEAQDWSFEMGSLSQVAGQGWKPDTVKPGDKLTLIMHPLKDGSHGGQYISATLPDGRNFHGGATDRNEPAKNAPQD